MALHSFSSMFQAKEKGANKTMTGLIFGSFEFVIFLCTPIFGQYVSISFYNNFKSMSLKTATQLNMTGTVGCGVVCYDGLVQPISCQEN